MKHNKLYTPLAVLLLLFCVSFAEAQRGRFRDGPDDKYFVAVSYGVGNAVWNSKIDQSALYDTSGAEMFTGNFRFKAKNTVKSINMDVSAPVMGIRLGMGISFEEFFIEKIKVNDNNYYFSEKFKFQKMFAQVEIPVKKLCTEDFSFNWKSQAGYYGYSHLNHINFFGMENGASVLFLNTGFIADYKLYPHTYAFLHPVFEYKYFRNSRKESPSVVIHNIFTYGMMFGIRVDVSRE